MTAYFHCLVEFRFLRPHLDQQINVAVGRGVAAGMGAEEDHPPGSELLDHLIDEALDFGQSDHDGKYTPLPPLCASRAGNGLPRPSPHATMEFAASTACGRPWPAILPAEFR